MAFVRLLKDLMKDKEIGARFVPIIPDEARTFGMDSLFPTAEDLHPARAAVHVGRPRAVHARLQGVRAPGQILHEGINEAGSVASFTAAGTSYATHGEPMIPVYIFYSMFGFQRTGDGFWAAADQMARGFLLGATAGRTTLNGEGLQHEDGHSLLLAATNPAVVAYDPAFALRDRAHRRGRAAPDVRRERRERPRERLLLPDRLQRAAPAAGRAGGRRRRRPARGHLPLRRRTAVTTTARRRSCWPPVSRCSGRCKAQRPAGRGLGRRRRRLVGDVLERAAPRRRRVPRSTTCCTPSEEPRVPYVTQALLADADGPGRGGVGLDARGAGPDPPVGARRLHLAGHRRLRPLRHPARAPPPLPRRRRVDHRRGAARARRAGRGGPVGRRPRRPRSTRSTTPRPPGRKRAIPEA